MTLYRTYYYRGGGPVDFPRDYNVVPPGPVTPRLVPNASPVGQAVTLALVADGGTGRILGELSPDLQRVSWLLNNYGDAAMSLPANDQAITGGLVSPGRRVLLQFDNGLPAWGGIIDTPIDRDGLSVSFSAYEAGYLLKDRRTGRNVVGPYQVWRLVRALLQETAAQYPTGIELAIDDTLTAEIEADYHHAPIWDVLTRDVARRAEFSMSAGLIGGSISFRMVMAPQIGRDRSDKICLLQGVNMQRPRVVDQGPILNEFYAYDATGDWDEESETARAIEVLTDPISVKRYGLRQGVISVSGEAVTTDILQAAGTAELEQSARPYRALTTNVMNLAPARFGDYGIGDTLGVLLLDKYGDAHEGEKRVVGREFEPATGTCKVVLR